MRLGAGIGLVAAACTESIFTLGKEHDSAFMGGVWNTVNVTAGIPVSTRTSLFGDVALVMRGVAGDRGARRQRQPLVHDLRGPRALA
jgi:hypothetical protein